MEEHHDHHFFIIIACAFILSGAIFWTTTNNTQAVPNLKPQKEVAKKACDTTSGSPVINVTQRIVNSVDSGQAGNYWAFDDYNRTIQVWKQSNNSYCALVDYQGKFDGQAGQTSPGNTTGTLTGNEDGTFKGGYRAVINGNLRSVPKLPIKGSIGLVDYQCDLTGNCPGAFSWPDKYFVNGETRYTFSYGWWGWDYTYKNKTWVNSVDGNSGDIL